MFNNNFITLIKQREEYIKLKKEAAETPLEKSFKFIIDSINYDIDKIIVLNQITNLGEKNMKPIFKEFSCPQCGNLRHININGICFDCNNENTLIALAEQRKSQHKLELSIQSLNVESYS
jgi:hypothetical protein